MSLTTFNTSYIGSGYMMSLKILCIFFILALFNLCYADQHKNTCKEIHDKLVHRQNKKDRANFILAYQQIRPGEDYYQGIDIEGDGIDDSIIRSCGAGINGLCSLYVNLSSGKKYELEEAKFFLIRVNKKIYVLVGETSEAEKYKTGKRNVYSISDGGIKIICDGL
ncbi:hypothetical protein ACQE3E_17585 [Methylomonas sp. MED-D]|uniref:hypothetical protein n=1 Tax=unclassified Methylomonas TaxID=2608980 RepID=UPI0028A41259|nr:hypothetical protein [Methylomonas sp. MV1]MDT4330832.1 hypothetical protein [Methylomonas sp. MV1]